MAEELALGLSDVGVARADQHVYRGDRLRTKRHRGDSLDATEYVNLIGAGQHHGGHGFRVRFSSGRWSAGDHALHAGHPGRHDGHVR